MAVNKRTNAGYHWRCGQLCYYCTPAKCLQATPISNLVKQEPQAALQVCGSFTVSIHSSENSGMVKLKSYLTSSTKLKQFGFFFFKITMMLYLTPCSGRCYFLFA